MSPPGDLPCASTVTSRISAFPELSTHYSLSHTLATKPENVHPPSVHVCVQRVLFAASILRVSLVNSFRSLRIVIHLFRERVSTLFASKVFRPQSVLCQDVCILVLVSWQLFVGTLLMAANIPSTPVNQYCSNLSAPGKYNNHHSFVTDNKTKQCHTCGGGRWRCGKLYSIRPIRRHITCRRLSYCPCCCCCCDMGQSVRDTPPRKL